MFKSLFPFLFLVIALSCTTSDTSRYSAAAPCGSLEPGDTTTLAGRLGVDLSAAEKSTLVYPLDHGAESLISRAWLCDHAQQTIDVQYYIFSKDNTGLIASDYLVRAADRGVKVRLIIDDVTVKASTDEIGVLDSHQNIAIKVYNPGVKLGKPGTRIRKIFTEAGELHRRMHVKTITFDNLVSITGGRNIADEYYDYDKEYNFRDRDVLLCGKEAESVRSSFELYWNDTLCREFSELVNTNKKKFRDPVRFERLHAYACDPKNFSDKMREKIREFPEQFRVKKLRWLKNVVFVADAPGKNEDRKGRRGGITTDSLIALVQSAKSTIDIQSPYLILTEKGRRFFKETVDRGVKVRVLTNSLAATDNFEAFSGYQRDREKILDTGIEVYEFKPDAQVRYRLMNPEVQAAISYSAVYGLHSKSMTIDNRITVIGSFNLDPRSADFNTECIVIIRDSSVTREMAKQIDTEFLPENAWHITREFNPDDQSSFNKQIKNQSRKVIPKNIL